MRADSERGHERAVYELATAVIMMGYVVRLPEEGQGDPKPAGGGFGEGTSGAPGKLACPGAGRAGGSVRSLRRQCLRDFAPILMGGLSDAFPPRTHFPKQTN